LPHAGLPASVEKAKEPLFPKHVQDLTSSGIRRFFHEKDLGMHTHDGSGVPKELHAMQSLFDVVWGAIGRDRRSAPKDAESLLEEIAEHVRDCVRRNLSEGEIRTEVLLAFGLSQGAGGEMKRAA